jgi:dTDP-4-dehydrorhamnose reductase
MKKKISLLIIGKNSFIASNLFLILKNKIYIKKIKYSAFVKKKEKFLSRFDYILNCSLNKKYVVEKYNKKNDFDYFILNKIKSLNINFIFLSTRKVYRPKLNILEEDNLKPYDNYAKNKIITENYIKKTIPKNYLILRISNIIGIRFVNNKKSHSLFFDNFILGVKNNFLINHKNIFKDFISISQFADIFFRILKKNLKGTFNVSLGEKVYLSEILKWLIVASKTYLKIKDIYDKPGYNSDNFTLNNQKLKKALNISIRKQDLKVYCHKISKKIFARIK